MTLNPTLDELVTRLGDRMNAEPAATFPNDRHEVQYPGLYSWWVDDAGAQMISAPFTEPISGLIYAGQAGAAARRSGKEGEATLVSRISTNHLGGNVGSSTFRHTLTAVLFEQLQLQLAAPKKLATASNRIVTEWMQAHLSLIVAACPDRSSLAALEDKVLAALDPPLNLQGMRTSAIRQTLGRLRKQLSQPAPSLDAAPAPQLPSSGMSTGPLGQVYRGVHPDATTGLTLCRFFEENPNRWYTHAELKAAIGCSDRIIREHVPAALNRSTHLLDVDRSGRAWKYRYRTHP